MKLQIKLLFSFIMIVILMGMTQSIFLKSSIESSFSNYLSKQHYGYMEKMKQSLELFYQQNQSWDNVQRLFGQSSSGRGMGRGAMMSNVEMILLDGEGVVIGDTKGIRLGNFAGDLQGKKENIVIDGQKKGELVLYQARYDGLEQDFLNASDKVIIYSGLIAGIIAILISFFVAKRITNPMNELMVGIHQIADGKKTRVHITTKDEFHELGNAFNHMVTELQKMDDARKALVADVAHELRTPLTILQGQLESIQEGAIKSSEEVIMGLTDEVYRLNRLVSDLQQLSLAEAGKLPLNKERTEIKPFIERICSHMKWLAEEGEISFLYKEIPNDCFLEIDKDRMTQVVVNLVGNALHHTPKEGIVEIAAHLDKEHFFLTVKDTGQGIPKEILPFIFDRFYKRDRSRNRNESGTGLGLSIAKGYVEAHGGKITVESEEGKGTVFMVVIDNTVPVD